MFNWFWKKLPGDMAANIEEEIIAEAELASPLYEYTFQTGFKSGGRFDGYKRGFNTREEAEASRQSLIETFVKAGAEKIGVMLDVNIGINGEDMSWFVVRPVSEIG